MKGKLTDNGVSKEREVSGGVHIHLEGEFAGGTASLQYKNDQGSLQLIEGQTQSQYGNRFDAGNDYGAGDEITLSDGTVVAVNEVTIGPAREVYDANIGQYAGATLGGPWLHNSPAVMGTTDGHLFVLHPNEYAFVDVTTVGFSEAVNVCALEFNVRYADETRIQIVRAHLLSTGTNASDTAGWRFEYYLEPGQGYYRLYRDGDVVVDYITVDRVVPQIFRFELNGSRVRVFANGVEVIDFDDAVVPTTQGNHFGFTNAPGAQGWAGIQDVFYYDLTVDNTGLEGVIGGQVTQFTVQSAGEDRDIIVGRNYGQASTTGVGVGFSLTAADMNVTETWRNIAGESYTAATDRFLNLPIGTTLRINLVDAGMPSVFYSYQIDISSYLGITETGDPIVYDIPGHLEFDVIYNGESRRGIAVATIINNSPASTESLGAARQYIAEGFANSINAAAGADIATAFDVFGDGTDWTFRIELDVEFEVIGLTAGLEFMSGLSSPEEGAPIMPNIFYEVRV